MLDVEKMGSLSAAQLRRAVHTWLDIVGRHYGVEPILYTGYKFKLANLNDSTFGAYPYWIAHYYVDHLEYKGPWSFWQYTDVGRVDGIKGFVDCNLFSGNLEQMMRLVIKEETIDSIGLRE